MIEKIESKNFDELFENLKNERKVKKSKDLELSKLTKDYQYFFKKLENPNIDYELIRVGEVVNGNIIEITNRDIIINISYKDDVYVDSRSLEKEMFENLKIGDPIDVMIMEIKENPYIIRGSVTELMKINVSNVVKDCYNNNDYLMATVIESHPAGYSLKMEVDGQIVVAFMPNTLAGVNKLHDPTSIVGQKLEVMIETLEQDKGIYVVSRKKYLESLIPEKIKSLKKEWMKNKEKIYNGIITGSTPFGAFVEFEEVLTGMIHRYNVNDEWRSDEKWSTLKPGMDIDFYIKDIITKKNKTILTQILRESLWDVIKIDDEIKGTVIALKPFGALIQLDEETNGLIQKTYLLKNKIDLHIGQEINVRVTSIMKDERKINLSIKQ